MTTKMWSHFKAPHLLINEYQAFSLALHADLKRLVRGAFRNCDLIVANRVCCSIHNFEHFKRILASKVVQYRGQFFPFYRKLLTLPTSGGFSVQPPPPAPVRSYTVSPSVSVRACPALPFGLATPAGADLH